MPIDANGQWYPNLSPKQLEVYNDTRSNILLSGPRVCGKTIVAVHKIIKHAWLYNNDRVGIFVKSTKTGKTGVWDDLLTYALPEWVEGLGHEGFKITVGPGVDGSTRMHFVRIANRHGGESEIQLHPLHFQDGVAEKMRGTRFGCLFFDEVEIYSNPEVFNVAVMQLRLIGLPEEKHLWLGTCNPAGGQDHWLFQKFYIDPHDETIDKSVRDTFALYDFRLSDNPFIKPETIAKLKLAYKNDPDMYQRYVNGLWTPDSRTVVFAGAYRDKVHKKGNDSDGTTLLPTEHCNEIFVGWDLGDRNHAVIFMEHVVGKDDDYWSILDEVVHIGEDVSIEEITYEVIAKMAELEKLAGRKVRFKHWSDRSAFDRYRSAADARDHILVNRYSAGSIELIGAPKPPHSVKARMALVRQLLIENRLFVSVNCTAVVEMFLRLTRGKSKAEPIKRDKNIHVFDGLSYALYGESIDEIEESMRPKLGERSREGFSLST